MPYLAQKDKMMDANNDFDNQIRVAVANGKKWCYDCIHYLRSTFGGYNASDCEIFGSLDADQSERHPDKSADVCQRYFQRAGHRWYEKGAAKTAEIDRTAFDLLVGVPKPLEKVRRGDYFKFDDAIWRVVEVTVAKSVKARIASDYNPRREVWESKIQCVPLDKCLFVKI